MVICKYCNREFKSVHAFYAHKCEGYVNERKKVKENKKKEEEDGDFICEGCGRHFKTKTSLYSHGRFCENYTPKKKPSVYKKSENEYVCECGKSFSNPQSLNAHFGHCDYHHECLGTERKKHPSEINHSLNWEKKTPEEIKEYRRRQGKAHSRNQKLGVAKNVWKGKTESETHKENIRKSTLKLLKEQGVTIRFNPNACKFIDVLNEEMGWSLQHALNGGEVEICGYSLDGYDKARNIVFEYDEPKHYSNVYENVLKKRDTERQSRIIQHLNCVFYRYNEKLGLLYKVN